MKVNLTHRNYGIHELVSTAEIPGGFADYAVPAEPGNEHRDDWVIDEAKLAAALPEGFLPVPARRVLLGVSDGDGGGTAHSGCEVFRPWAKYFDAYMLWLVKSSDEAEPGSAEAAILPEDQVEALQAEQADLTRGSTT